MNFDDLAFVLFLIFLIIVIGLVVFAIVAWTRRDRVPEPDPGIGTVRRLYFYVVAFVALMMAANGLVQIISFVLDDLFGGDVISASRTGLAIGASLTIVGLPLWAVHWMLVQRYVREMPVEQRSLIRKLYAYAVLAVAITFIIVSVIVLLDWAFGSRSFIGFPWGALMVWGVVWAFHWRLERTEGQPTAETLAIRRLYLYGVSLATLVMTVVGLGQIINIILLEGYDALFSVSVLVPTGSGLWRPAMRTAIGLSMVGSVAWGAHWLYFARQDLGSILRQVYLYVFAILGGVVTALIALGIIIGGFLMWLLGVPTDETAAAQFRFLPGALASLSIGVGLWAYHWTVVRKEAEISPYESQLVRRSYAYILSALGLGAIVIAIGTLVHTAITVIIESSRIVITGQDLWREPIAVSITLLLLGLPLWGYYWTALQKQVSAGDAEERNALARRIFIFAVLGVGMLALLGSVSSLIFIFLKDVLGGGLSHSTLRDIRVPIDIIVAAAIFLPYYFMVYRQDRQAEPETLEPVARRRRKEVSILVSEDGNELVRNLEAALGYRITALRWADPDIRLPALSEVDYEELARRIDDAAGQRVLLVPNESEVRVLSYN